MEHTTNSITIRGSLLSLPQFSHENHGKRFYRFTLEVPRLSGAVDLLPVIAPAQVLEAIDPSAVRFVPTTSAQRGYGIC